MNVDRLSSRTLSTFPPSFENQYCSRNILSFWFLKICSQNFKIKFFVEQPFGHWQTTTTTKKRSLSVNMLWLHNQFKHPMFAWTSSFTSSYERIHVVRTLCLPFLFVFVHFFITSNSSIIIICCDVTDVAISNLRICVDFGAKITQPDLIAPQQFNATMPPSNGLCVCGRPYCGRWSEYICRCYLSSIFQWMYVSFNKFLYYYLSKGNTGIEKKISTIIAFLLKDTKLLLVWQPGEFLILSYYRLFAFLR